jgi:hypothetical protein
MNGKMSSKTFSVTLNSNGPFFRISSSFFQLNKQVPVAFSNGFNSITLISSSFTCKSIMKFFWEMLRVGRMTKFDFEFLPCSLTTLQNSKGNCIVRLRSSFRCRRSNEILCQWKVVCTIFGESKKPDGEMGDPYVEFLFTQQLKTFRKVFINSVAPNK